MLERWRTEAETALHSAGGITDNARLRATAQLIAATTGHDSSALSCEPMIRAWAQGNASIADHLRGVDTLRLAQLCDMLVACSIGNPEIARILYTAAIGMQGLQDAGRAQTANAIGTLVNLILALRG